MKRRNVVPHPEAITKVNVTPIIDVALVLVIILMVTAPLMSVADLPANLPAARTREAEREIARYVATTQGKWTDQVEREIERRPAAAEVVVELAPRLVERARRA
jgi:biopolymer transport protein ExbD